MNNSRILIALAIAGLALGACSNNDKSGTDSDSTAVESSVTDSISTDTPAVKAADSTTSFRNDRGTDSVSAGKSVPAKP
jgi:ABC-type oligopeptide transport system substrate-binding subunit